MVLALAAVVVVGACGGTDPSPPSASGPGSTGAPATVPPATEVRRDDRLGLSGTASLDGVPFDAEFLGAVVLDEGLATSCQRDLAEVAGGSYQIAVLGEHEAAGCGRAGTDVVLWTYVGDQQLYSTASVPWPTDAPVATFAAAFSVSAPNGVMRPATELAGEVYGADGRKLGPGLRVEALVDGTLCGVSTTRENGDFVGFALSVVGPDSVAGCTWGAPITFRVDGRDADETLANDASLHRSFDLTVR